MAQSKTVPPDIVQPREKTKAGFPHGLAHFAIKP